MSVVAQASDLEIGEPKLPRYRKPPKRFGGSDPHQFDEPKMCFRQKYYSACDILIQELLDRFKQEEFMQPVLTMESLLIKYANGECHTDELRTMKESVFKGDLNFDSLEGILEYWLMLFIRHYHRLRESLVFELSVMQ